MGIKIIKSGLMTTVQDTGRFGYLKDGIIVSGAMDVLALRIGNALVGNAENDAGIECTLLGPSITFTSSQMIAITGADLSPQINGIPVQMWKPIVVAENDILSFGAALKGCRAYLSFYGGLDIEPVLDSRSTYLKAGFGGFKGRTLSPGDEIGFRKTYTGSTSKFNWAFDSKLYNELDNPIIRVIKGPEYESFNESSQQDLINQDFQLTNETDRMGYKLAGPKLTRIQEKELLSSAVTFGTIQVTNNGAAIILMADHQTTGGYPRIAQVITADFSKLAQLKSGQKIRFEWIDLSEAQSILRNREQKIKQLQQTLNLKHSLI